MFGPEVPIPDRIQIAGPNTPLPEEIQIVNRNVPEEIELVVNDPIRVELDREIPDKIVIEAPNLPEKILLEAVGIPDQIEVSGIPDSIEVTGFPEFIPLKMPDNPEIEMVYKGAPIEVKVDLQPIMAQQDANGNPKNCVMIVPCQN